MSNVHKLAFASSALPSRIIGSLDKCLLKELHEIIIINNEQYSLCWRKANYEQMFRVRSLCYPATITYFQIWFGMNPHLYT